MRKNKPRQKFVAISRFGIGVLSSFIVGDRIEVSTRRRLPDGKLAVPLRLSLNGLYDFFVMQEQPMVPNAFPSRAGREAGYRKTTGTSVAVRIEPTKSDVTLEQLLERTREAFSFPPVRVFINDIEQHDCQLSRLDTPLIDRVVRHLPEGQGRIDASLLATGELTVVAVPLDLTAHSSSLAVRGQLVAIMAEATGGTSFLPALPEDVRHSVPESLVRDLDTCIVNRFASVSERDDYRVYVGLTLICRSRVLQNLRDWFRDTEYYGLRSYASFELLLEASLELHDETTQLRGAFSFDLRDIIEEQAIRLLDRGWLGHNGITVTTRLEQSGSISRSPDLRLLSDPRFALLGPVTLFDELRPDVSVSRDTLRALTFPIRSALHLAVRRAAAAYLTTPDRDLAKQIMQSNLLGMLPLGEITTAEIEADPLLPEWRSERLIASEPNAPYNVAEVRELAENGPMDLKLPLIVWSAELYDSEYKRLRDFYETRPPPGLFETTSLWGFYDTLKLAMAEFELDIGLKHIPKESLATRHYDVTVRSARRPIRPPGLATLPPFAALPYPTPDVLVGPCFPANLAHPVVGWFTEHAAVLQTDYPAFFAQFKRALAMVSNLRYHRRLNEQTASAAAELLNATLDRIRRAVPASIGALSVEVYADPEHRLRSRP